ncbi:hypothetical protein DK292_16175, partial [Listeria monocytogenes]
LVFNMFVSDMVIWSVIVLVYFVGILAVKFRFFENIYISFKKTPKKMLNIANSGNTNVTPRRIKSRL